ncbi:MAG: glycoside hydrolase family 97 protein [Bacteroidales bacterium]
MNFKICLLTLCFVPGLLPAQKKITLNSPDKTLTAEVEAGDQLRLSVFSGSEVILAPSAIGMKLRNYAVLGENPQVKDIKRQVITEKITTPIYKKELIHKKGNEVTIRFKNDYALVVRCFDDGVAYRFTTSLGDSVFVENEIANYVFPDQTIGYAAYGNRRTNEPVENQYLNSFENTYDIKPLTQLNHNRLSILPFLAKTPTGKNVCILETDLQDYPGMFVLNTPDQFMLKGEYATVPKVTEQGGHNMLQQMVKERDGFIARTSGNRAYPWRIFAITEKDGDLLNNDLAYTLSAPSVIGDPSWIKPGKVAWDWWNAWNLEGVDFRTGINNQTYKYYIDFASRNGIEYVILDEGWAVNKKADLMQVIPEIDLKELVSYAKQRNVDLILWAGYWAYHRDMEKVTKHYADMGIKGFKIDFLDRDDQPMINFMWDAAKICADHKMLIDFHGCCKPFGIQRTYPNVINFEGVMGLEQLKWSPNNYDQVTYDLTFPFIRMVSGCVDYTQGAMRNAAKGAYRPISHKAMSQGTRCRQLATYVVFESPLNMLCDAPTSYEKEPECTEFIAAIPTIWDDTHAMPSEITKYITIARRKGSSWYVAALNDWSKRSMELDLSFLDEGNYRMVIFKDGINADRTATDYVKEIIPVPADRKMNIQMAPGGGWVAKIVKF